MPAAIDIPPVLSPLTAFRNEPYADFNRPEMRAVYLAALEKVRGRLGREYLCRIGDRSLGANEKFQSLNPARSSEVIGIHSEATPAMAAEAVDEAARTFPCWRLAPVANRVEILRRVAGLLRERKPEFAAWMSLEVGKSFPEAEADVAEAIDFCEFYALQMLHLGAGTPLPQLPGERNLLVHLPLGVVAVIPPWNFPLAIMAGMTVAAWVAGNTVVLKPSSDSATIAAIFYELLGEAGLPAGVVNLVTGSGAAVGRALVEDARVRAIAFTGSKAAGLDINERAARSAPGQRWIKRAILEMGGKDAIVVAADADLDAAADGIVASAFGYQGQKCSACSRAIVADAVYDDLLERLQSRIPKIRVGSPQDFSCAMGPVIHARAMEKILGYIEIGKSEGRLLAGGKRLTGPEFDEGFYIAPTLIADVAPRARLAQEEVFGPVLAVIRCRDLAEGLAIANDSEYGLTGAVYSRDPQNLALARRDFHAGNLYLNRKCTGAMVGAHPFGGFNLSGTDSKAGGPDYLQLFTQAQSIAEKI